MNKINEDFKRGLRILGLEESYLIMPRKNKKAIKNRILKHRKEYTHDSESFDEVDQFIDPISLDQLHSNKYSN